MTDVKKDANPLLDYLLKGFFLKNDAALAKELGYGPPMISKMRHLRVNPSADFILAVHKRYGLSVWDIERHIVDIPEDQRAS